MKKLHAFALLLVISSIPLNALAQSSDSDLAQQLSNPIASLISLPFQFNFDERFGPEDDGTKNVLNIQPVIPVPLNEDWNMISRTIVPLVWQDELFPGAGDQHGVGDITQSLFFSPALPTNGVIWGVGPVALIPSYSDPLISSEKWGAGPTAVVLTQRDGWTVGALANHIWSFAGEEDRNDINSTFLQPFLSYTTPDAWTFTLNTESTYNWNTEDWGVPINMQVSKLVKFGEQPVSLAAAARYWANSTTNGAEGWAFRASVTFLFPTGG